LKLRGRENGPGAVRQGTKGKKTGASYGKGRKKEKS